MSGLGCGISLPQHKELVLSKWSVVAKEIAEEGRGR